MNIVNHIEELIGNTPLMRLNAFEKAFSLSVELYAKLEYFNVTGSIKDRAALKMIQDAEQAGILKEGAVIIEPTSGNTGIGLAAIGRAKGYEVIIVMPDSFSIERRKMIQAYGAKVVLSDGALGMAGAVQKANELAASYPSAFIPSQFDNPSNWMAHYETTGPELYKQMDGQIDTLIATVGTGGTLTGIGKYLKEKSPSTKIIAVEPEASPLLSKGTSGKHGIQGIGANFIPSILDQSIYDEILCVKDEDAYQKAQAFAYTQGIFVGISSGAALSAAIKYAKKEENKGKKIIIILPDSGDRYLSTNLIKE